MKKQSFFRKFIIALGVITVLLLILFSIRMYNLHRNYPVKETRFMMDTYVTIYTIGPKKISSGAVAAAFQRMEEIAVKFNSLDPKSPLYAFNKNGVPLSDPEIVSLVKAGLEMSKESRGAFDMTVAPLLELWGFYDKNFRIPQDNEIKECLQNVGYQHLKFDNGVIRKDRPGVMIDLGGIAKGYALNEAAKVLKNSGVTSAVIDAGGDVLAIGRKGSRLWRVGIKDPRSEGIIGYVEVEDLAVIGSGDYERFFIKDGKRYCHIFDSKTGYPSQGVASVTLIYPDPVIAQPLAKIPFIVGAEKGLETLEKIPAMEAVIITTSGEKFLSQGLKHMLNISPAENQQKGE